MIEATIRGSSLSTLLDCPARWKGIQDGARGRSSGRAWLGTSVHHGTAVFDKSVLAGDGLTVMDAAGAFVDKLHHPDEDVEWWDISTRSAEEIGLRLVGDYCRDWAPKMDYVLIEEPLDALTIEVDDELLITLTGTLDRVRRMMVADADSGGAQLELRGVTDLKSGMRAVSADGTVDVKTHKPQVGIYELLTEVQTGTPMTLPATIFGLKTSGTPAVSHATLPGAKDALLNLYLPAAAMYFKADFFPGNPRSMLCSEKYCPIFDRCKWRG